MPDVTRASSRDRLLAERERILDQLRQMGRLPGSELDFDEGFADSGQVTAERGEVDALAGTLLETLGEIDGALARIEDGSYGRDEITGDPIAPERLEAVPWARTNVTTPAGGRARRSAR